MYRIIKHLNSKKILINVSNKIFVSILLKLNYMEQTLPISRIFNNLKNDLSF